MVYSEAAGLARERDYVACAGPLYFSVWVMSVRRGLGAVGHVARCSGRGTTLCLRILVFLFVFVVLVFFILRSGTVNICFGVRVGTAKRCEKYGGGFVENWCLSLLVVRRGCGAPSFLQHRAEQTTTLNIRQDSTPHSVGNQSPAKNHHHNPRPCPRSRLLPPPINQSINLPCSLACGLVPPLALFRRLLLVIDTAVKFAMGKQP